MHTQTHIHMQDPAHAHAHAHTHTHAHTRTHTHTHTHIQEPAHTRAPLYNDDTPVRQLQRQRRRGVRRHPHRYGDAHRKQRQRRGLPGARVRQYVVQVQCACREVKVSAPAQSRDDGDNRRWAALTIHHGHFVQQLAPVKQRHVEDERPQEHLHSGGNDAASDGARLNRRASHKQQSASNHVHKWGQSRQAGFHGAAAWRRGVAQCRMPITPRAMPGTLLHVFHHSATYGDHTWSSSHLWRTGTGMNTQKENVR